jgi:hypothetical protein
MAGIINNFVEKKRISETDSDVEHAPTLADTEKSFYERVWPVLACGAGLFSDGYLNGVCSSATSLSTPLRYHRSLAPFLPVFRASTPRNTQTHQPAGMSRPSPLLALYLEP